MARRRSHRNSQLRRLLAILRDLDRRDGADVYELAANHGATVRTIWRDLAALGEAGLPLVEERDGQRSRWRLAYPDPRRRPAGNASLAHYTALRTVLELGAGAAATGPLTDLMSRSEGALTDEERRRLTSVAGCVGATGPGALDDGSPDLLVPLVLAASERRCCRIVYRPPGGRRSTLEVVPLRLFGRDGATYVRVHHRRRDVSLTLAVRRIVQLTVLEQRDERPTPVDSRQQVDTMFGVHGSGELVRYRLRFAAEVAPYLRERRWHPTQTLRRSRDGAVVLSFLCQESFEVSAWVASWRQHVTVLAPATLRRELEALGRELSVRYAAHAPLARP